MAGYQRADSREREFYHVCNKRHKSMSRVTTLSTCMVSLQRRRSVNEAGQSGDSEEKWREGFTNRSNQHGPAWSVSLC